MFRFTIRDVLSLTVVVGVLVAWWIHDRLDNRCRSENASNTSSPMTVENSKC